MIDVKLALDEVNEGAGPASAGLAKAVADRSSWRLAGAAAAAAAAIIGLLVCGERAGRSSATRQLPSLPLTTLPGIERYPSAFAGRQPGCVHVDGAQR